MCFYLTSLSMMSFDVDGTSCLIVHITLYEDQCILKRCANGKRACHFKLFYEMSLKQAYIGKHKTILVWNHWAYNIDIWYVASPSRHLSNV